MASAPPQSEPDLLYSGTSLPGYTERGTYDRLIWNGSHEFLPDTEAVLSRIHDCLAHFDESDASRLVARMRIAPSVNVRQLRQHIHNRCEMTVRPETQEQCAHLTLGMNSQARAVPLPNILAMQATVQRKIDAAKTLDFREHALSLRRRVRNEGMSFAEDPTADDIHRLWQHSFGWSREQCNAYAHNADPSSRIFLLRNGDGDAISGLLVSGGESTEWATLPEHQGRGHIVPLLLYANCALIRDRVASVFAELRWDRSINPALQSGFSIDSNNGEPWLLTNHVTIGDSPTLDPPDPWNQHRPHFGNSTDGAMLRSFAVAHLHPETFHDDVLDSYLSHS